MQVVGTFLEYDGRFVILLRHSHKSAGDHWGLPAGKVDPGETTRQAARRELEEETGYNASEEDLNHLGDYEFDGYTFSTYQLSLDEPFEVIVEEAAHAEIRWVTPQECYDLENLVPDLHDLLKIINYV